MFDTPQIPTIHLGWLAPEAFAAEPYREVFVQALFAHGWPQIVLDEGLADRGTAGFADRFAWQEAQDAAPAERLTLASHPVQVPGDLEAAFAAMARQGADGLLTCEDALTVAQRRSIIALAAVLRLPAVYPLREFVEAGGLMAYGPNLTSLYRGAAAYVDRLLRGAKPADLPIEPPMQYELGFHRQTALALGLMLLSSLVEQADDVLG